VEVRTILVLRTPTADYSVLRGDGDRGLEGKSSLLVPTVQTIGVGRARRIWGKVDERFVDNQANVMCPAGVDQFGKKGVRDGGAGRVIGIAYDNEIRPFAMKGLEKRPSVELEAYFRPE